MSLVLTLQIKRQGLECYFYVRQILENVMVTIGKVVPRQGQTQGTVPLTRLQKAIGLCLLLMYVSLIVVTIATLPYVANIDANVLPTFWQSRNLER
jgi:hypothetical protein